MLCFVTLSITWKYIVCVYSLFCVCHFVVFCLDGSAMLLMLFLSSVAFIPVLIFFSATQTVCPCLHYPELRDLMCETEGEIKKKYYRASGSLLYKYGDKTKYRALARETTIMTTKKTKRINSIHRAYKYKSSSANTMKQQ